MYRDDNPAHMIRIAIVDDHAIVRAGLRQFFADQVDFVVAAEAANGREALDIVRKGEVDVVLLDISMPGQGGVDTLAAIRARAPDLPVLILSGFAEEHYATALLRQGASGYLNKDCDPEEIVRAIRTVYRGRKYVTASMAERLAESVGGGGDKAPFEKLLQSKINGLRASHRTTRMQRRLIAQKNGRAGLAKISQSFERGSARLHQ